jgi:nucleoid-associated protein YgaU
VTPESIIALNELRNPNLIVPGQLLLIPVAPASPAP